MWVLLVNCVGKYVGKVCACVWVNLHLVTQMASLSDIVAIIERLSDCGQVWETVDRSWRLCEGWGDSGKVGKMVGRLSGEWNLVMGVGMLSRGRGYYQGGGDIAKRVGMLSGDRDVPRSQSDVWSDATCHQRSGHYHHIHAHTNTHFHTHMAKETMGKLEKLARSRLL